MASGTMTREELATQVMCARNRAKLRVVDDQDTYVIVSLADENDRLRAERDECVALLEDDVSGTNVGDWVKRKLVLLAKMRTP